jgi:N-acetylmuramoyl-L-alanine amidase
MPAFLMAVAVALMLMAGAGRAMADESLIASTARLGEHPDHTRFVIEFSESLKYRVFTLADPYRLVIDLPQVKWKLPAETGLTGKGLVKGYRYGQYRPGNSRVVLDLWKPAEVTEHFILPPSDSGHYRLVINMSPTSRAAFLATAGWPEDLNGSAQSRDLIAKDEEVKSRRPLVVIDPGHGGADPGAQGSSGSQEKEVVLDVALALRDLLIADGGYDVVLTRDADVFVALGERVAIARRSQADLFISLHADSIGKSGVRGASVYTLSEKASDSETQRLANSENAADIVAGADLTTESVEVRDILIALAQRETQNYSVSFARTLTGRLSREIYVMERPHRFAGFKVLKAPDVPSVLVELGFLSDERDEKALTSTQWQEKVASAVYRAVGDYFGGRQTPVAKPIPTPRRAIRDKLTLGAAPAGTGH